MGCDCIKFLIIAFLFTFYIVMAIRFRSPWCILFPDDNFTEHQFVCMH